MSRLSSSLFPLLTALYGEHATRIIAELEAEIAQPAPLSIHSNIAYQAQQLIMYTTYADTICYDNAISPLQNIILHLPFIKSLGCNALHILPFLASPMRDKGFDVSDYYTIRPELGDKNDLYTLIQTANKLDIALFMDLVFNHVSDQHAWFGKAQAGDSHYQDYFYTKAEKPQFIRKYHHLNAVWAEFFVDGKPLPISIAFPELIDELPLWRKGNDHHWYYYTYYPFQLDLNWHNPNVFIEMAKILIYWTKLGFHFRVDALPFIGKVPYKFTDINHTPAHQIIQTLRHISHHINPNCLLLGESYERRHIVMSYFGSDNKPEFDLAYNFHLCTNIWVSIVKKQNEYIWDTIMSQSHIPIHAGWLNFLRNHDELSLAYLTPKTTHDMQSQLEAFGYPFREGFGISGRTFSLLAAHTQKFKMAYALLASLPYSIMLVYGDEIAKSNEEASSLNEEEKLDTRNFNRGYISHHDLIANSEMIAFFKSLFNTRKTYAEYFSQVPNMLPAPCFTFSAVYRINSSSLFVFVNLSEQTCHIPLFGANLQTIFTANEIKSEQDELILGAYAIAWFLQD